MKVQKITKPQGEFAKKGEDIKGGDVVKIKSEGEYIDGQYGQQFVIKIETPGGEEKNVNFNQTTINILHDELGEDSVNWIGKEVIIRVKKDVVAGKKVEIYYFVTQEWDFDEYRELVKKEDISSDIKKDPELEQAREQAKQEEENKSVPDPRVEDSVDPDDIKF